MALLDDLRRIEGEVGAIADKELGDYPTSYAERGNYALAHQIGRLAAAVAILIDWAIQQEADRDA